jgi:uncharacterized membrane protein YkoI
MPRFFLLLLSLLLSASLLQANPRDAKSGAKITKNEAEHIALKDHPGARVTAARLEKTGGKLVWLVDVSEPTAIQLIHITVDAMSGRILAQKKEDR